MATEQAKPKGRKAKVASEQVASRKSARISDLGAAKRKAAEDMSPSSIKKRKPEEGKLAEKLVVKKMKKAEEKKEKKKKEEEEQVEAPVSTEKKPATKKTQQKQKKASKVPEPAEEKEEKEKAEREEKGQVAEEEEEEDDTTKALVQDLDSGDEESGGASLFEPGQDVGKVPPVAPPRKRGGAAAKGTTGSKVAAAAAAAAVAAAASATSGSSNEQRGGVVYIGRIPHGFFEHEMRSYFSQFGDIRRLRLSRNRRTGASKHYAFIEFSDADVAEIVAQTMDSYLLFGHILRCSVVPPERVPANLFAGANRRFKVVPWNRLAGRQLAEPKSESGWEAQVSRESRRRSKRASLLREKIGYAYEAPSLKKPVAASGEEGGSEEAGAEAEADKTIEAPAAEDEVAAPAEKEEEEGGEEDKRTEAAATTPKGAKASKAKKAKGKKSKA